MVTQRNGHETSRSEAQQVLGSPGLSLFSGMVGEEYLNALKPWSREVRVYLEMRDDIVIGTLLDAIKTPLLAAPFEVQPASEDQADVEAAEFIEQNINGMSRQSWRAHVEDQLEVLDFGFALSEIVLEKRDDGRLWLRNLEPRGQETLRRWVVEDGDIVGFEQGPPLLGGLVRANQLARIPLDKVVHGTFRGRKGNPQGRSLLRSLYRPWKFAKNIENFEGIGVERDVGGMPVATLPDPETIGRLTDKDIDDLDKALRGLRMDERAYLRLPHGVQVEPYTGGSRVFNMREIIRDKHNEILTRFFAQFVKLGQERVGTQALVKGAQTFFMLGLRSIQQQMMETWNQQLVPFLFRWNELRGEMPRIRWGEPGDIDVEALLGAYGRGTTARVITPTRPDEDHLRGLLDLPELDDDVLWPGPRPQPGLGGLGGAGGPAGGGESSNEQIAALLAAGNSQSEVSDQLGVSRSTVAQVARQLAEADEAITFADPSEVPAGQDLRTRGGIYERFVNDYQRDLVEEYDQWARETARLAALPNKSAAQIQSTIEGRLLDLESNLTRIANRRIGEAATLGLGSRLQPFADSPRVQQIVAQMVDEAQQNIRTSLIPSIRERIQADLPEFAQIGERGARATAFRNAMNLRRHRVAQNAGGAVTAIFRAQAAAGSELNSQRQRQGEPPVAVRWVLDPRAEHCEDDPQRGTFGCPGLARTYPGGWDELPTVPAGNVTCLGNDRCVLEADFGSGFERIT